MKVIFLDIDGVVCIKKHHEFATRESADYCKHTGAKIVLSSNWRLYPKLRTRIIQELKFLNVDVIGWTMSMNDVRAYEIYQWIKEHRPKMCIIIDDRPLHLKSYGNRIGKLFFRQRSWVSPTILWRTPYASWIFFRSLQTATLSFVSRTRSQSS